MTDAGWSARHNIGYRTHDEVKSVGGGGGHPEAKTALAAAPTAGSIYPEQSRADERVSIRANDDRTKMTHTIIDFGAAAPAPCSPKPPPTATLCCRSKYFAGSAASVSMGH